MRLISGRNSPVYSFGATQISEVDPNLLGKQILEIWNDRVTGVRQYFKHLRTVVLIKSDDLTEVAVFEFDTIRYDPELYSWKWNKNKNLEGYENNTNYHKFTWQPHGSQFTIIEDVSDDCLIIKIVKPKKLNCEQVLNGIGFKKNWVTVFKKNGG